MTVSLRSIDFIALGRHLYMMKAETQIRSPGRLLLFFFRLPLVLYRVRLGNLMFFQMLLKTVGRKTGRQHRVLVDILEHSKAEDVYYVNAAFGSRSHWYLNIEANPNVHGQVGGRKFVARATILPSREAADVLVRFVRRHRRYVRVMMRVIGVKTGFSEDEIHSLALQMPVIAIKPVCSVSSYHIRCEKSGVCGGISNCVRFKSISTDIFF